MSSTPTREAAKRVFADEFADASHAYKESDDEKAPQYNLLPTGGKANRIFAVGTVTEVQDVGSDSEYWQARVVDPTGTFMVYAGQYQPEAAATLQGLEAPEYVAVVGKPRTYETDEGDVRVSVRPESVTVVDSETRDQWVAETAAQTLERIQAFEEGHREAELVEAHYEAGGEAYAETVIEALEDLDEAAMASEEETESEVTA